jgi:hypothetical protein
MQSIAQDKIIKLSEETINCNVSEIGDDYVKYTSNGEVFQRNISTDNIKEIVFASGIAETINQKTQINSAHS